MIPIDFEINLSKVKVTEIVDMLVYIENTYTVLSYIKNI